MKLFIKNMVCIRCIMVVKAELEKIGLAYAKVELGVAEIAGNISIAEHDAFKDALLKSGLELIDDKKSVLIEKIKAVIIEQVHYSEDPLSVCFSDFLQEKLHHNYTYLSSLFIEVQGTTIEKFVILHKIERVKELLVYDELNLTDIAYQMNYSSVSHLSTQFKKVTGFTTTHFKGLRDKRLSRLNDIAMM